MLDYRYLIVGGGMTAHAACKAIRARDPEGTMALVGAESHAPYKRPPLTKGLWKGESDDSVNLETEKLNVDLHLGRRITSLDVAGSSATDDAGGDWSYDRLLLATGGTPREFPFDAEEVIYFRTLDDYRRARELADRGGRVVVVGGGFIGSEICAALTMNGCETSLVFPEKAVGARLFPAELAAFVTDYYRSKGVDVQAGESIARLEAGAPGRVVLESGRSIDAAAVIAGLGIAPVTELAESAGLPVNDGIVVDELGRVGGRDDVYAAGDVARFPLIALGGTTTRVEHEDHANSHGACVGANMAGDRTSYDHLPFFYSDLFDLGYEAVGELDARSEMLEHWVEPNRKGVVCYVDAQSRPRGFLLWDVWERVDDARALLRAGQPIEATALRELAAE